MSKKKSKKQQKKQNNSPQQTLKTNDNQKVISQLPGANENLNPPDLGRPDKEVIPFTDVYLEKVRPYLNQISELVLIGYTNLEIAHALDISEETFYQYKKNYPEFSESITKNKPLANDKIIRSLYQRAQNQEVEETEEIEETQFRKDKETGREIPLLDDYGNPIIKRKKVKRTKVIPGDVKAMQFWLMNRGRNLWSNKVDGNTINIDNKNLNANQNINENTNTNQNLNLNYLSEKQQLEALEFYKRLFIENHTDYDISSS